MRFKSLGKKATLVTIISIGGSSPQEVGVKMLVRTDGTYIGSMDGGSLEAVVYREAIKAIEEGRQEIFRFKLYYEGKEKT